MMSLFECLNQGKALALRSGRYPPDNQAYEHRTHDNPEDSPHDDSKAGVDWFDVMRMVGGQTVVRRLGVCGLLGWIFICCVVFHVGAPTRRPSLVVGNRLSLVNRWPPN